MATYAHIGLDFVNALGSRITVIQLVESGKAIANCEFTDGKVTRSLCIDRVDRKQFLKTAFNLFRNSIPVTFTTNHL